MEKSFDLSKCIDAGVKVLQEEAQALLDLVPTIGGDFKKACEIILQTRGKVVLTGVGKSGHVATKIASTLASTGTQSFFVQSDEAAHGDLGMIGPEDTVIAISNSGEGTELKTIIPLLKRRGIKLIAMTGGLESTLARAADVVLDAHVEHEACPLNLAPTSSSTAEIALGDALAVALIEARNFTKNDFAMSHPGGMLGRRLFIRCEDIMHKGADCPTVTLDVSIKDALFEMTKKGIGFVCVTDDKNVLRGLFTDGDIRRAFERGASLDSPVKDFMTADVKGALPPDTLAYAGLDFMRQKRINGLVIVDEERRVLGAFNLHDLMQAGIV